MDEMEAVIKKLQRQVVTLSQNEPSCVCNGSEVLDKIQEDIQQNKEDIADLRQV